MAQSRYYTSTAQPTVLTSSITPSSTIVNVQAVTGFPISYPYVVALGYGTSSEELVLVTSAVGTSLTVTRAFDGTSASSHNAGEPVRHTWSGADGNDSRLHESLSTGVHGVAGVVVGTTDSQSLSNKTISASSWSGGSITGTVSGTHTLSGAVTITQNLTLSAGLTASTNLAVTGAALSTIAFRSLVSGDSFSRWNIQCDGKQGWGPGNLGTDTFLYRNGVNLLKTDGALNIVGLLTGNAGANFTGARVAYTGVFTTTEVAFASNPNSETFDRFRIQADGLLEWGTGAIARDTNLYRSAPNVLKTDDSFTFAGTLTHSTSGITYPQYQQGQATVNFSAVTQQDAVITFPTPFLTTPTVVCSRQNSPGNSAKVLVNATNVTASGFTMRFNSGDGTALTITGLTGGYIAVAS